MVVTDLIAAYYNRLAGADAHGTTLSNGGEDVPVFTGSPGKDASAPLALIGRPRTRGQETIDGVEIPEVRLQLRIHTAFPPAKANHFQCYQIAEAAHRLLEAAPLSVGDKEPYVPEPNLQPIQPYDKGDKEAVDLSLLYVYPSL